MKLMKNFVTRIVIIFTSWMVILVCYAGYSALMGILKQIPAVTALNFAGVTSACPPKLEDIYRYGST